MRRSKIVPSLIVSISIVISLGAIYGLAAASAPASPPSTIQVEMFHLDGGLIVTIGNTPAACNTPINQNRMGCTAFYQPTNVLTPPPATVVAYPYGSTAAPDLSFDDEYLKNVVPLEMSVDIAPPAALQAQAIAARSYAWKKVGNLNNSIGSQHFVPYYYEFLRVVQGDAAHNPTTTPTAALSNCSLITPTYQRAICDALSTPEVNYITPHETDEPALAEFSADAWMQTNAGATPNLQSVADPISTPVAIQTTVAETGAHGRGMSQLGAIRWARGAINAFGDPTPWSVKWERPEQILTHYYADVDLRDAICLIL